MTRLNYDIEEAKDPALVQLTKGELEQLGTKEANTELERRKANREAERAAKAAAKKEKK